MHFTFAPHTFMQSLLEKHLRSACSPISRHMPHVRSAALQQTNSGAVFGLSLMAAIEYVLNGQGERMACYVCD